MKPAQPQATWTCEREDPHAAHGYCGGLVPDDWIRVECANGGCENGVWLPPDALDHAPPGTPVKAVCSAECGMAVLARSGPGSSYVDLASNA